MTQSAGDRTTALRLIQLFDPDTLPLAHFLPTEDLREVFSRTLVGGYEETFDDATDTRRFEFAFATEEEVSIRLPGLGATEIVFGGPASSAVTIGAEYAPDARAVTLGGGLCLRFPRDWLRPVARDGDGWIDDPSREFVELDFGGGVTVNQDFDVSFAGTNAFTIEPAMIGDTGFVIEGTVAVDLSESSTIPASTGMGLDPTWRGVVFDSLQLHLPPDLDVPGAPSDLQLEDFRIGGGGISGTIGGNWASGLAGELFGMAFELQSIDVEFRETALVGAAAKGTVTLPFFDGPVDLALGITGDGTVTAALDTDDGLVTLDHDAYGLEVDGLEFTNQGVPAVSLSGTLTPKLIPDAPGVRVDELRVDADGKVHVEGGWLSLPDQYSIDFHGFGFEITAFGIGRNDDGSKWLGLNGGVKFVDELGAGASVDGLRVTWFDDGPRAGDAPMVSFDGVGVELEIPDAVRFKGAVSYTEGTDDQGNVDHRFEGAISLDLLALDISVDGTLVVGTRTEDTRTFTYCAVYLDADLPSGIPLFATGLSLYGFSGLYAQNMAPALESDEEWFSRDPDVDSWYHRQPEGATDFRGSPSKWPVDEGAFALGAGVTLGTASDNGYSFSGTLLLVIAFPGPVVMLNGEATMLADRADLDSGDPNFSALAVLDGRAGTFTFGLDAQYRYGDGGELVDIGASVEAFYDLNDPSAWYVYIGRKEPREKRVRATLFSLFEANGYVMLDPRQLAMGAWYGYDDGLSVGPFGVDIEAWIAGDAVLSFQPAHFTGALAARGAVRLRAFGFSAGISLDATIAAEVFDPFHLLGKFRVALELPGFLPDPSATVTLEWGPRPEPPELPDPLQEVAVGHDLSTTTWPLALEGDTPPTGDLPVVPLDGRPELTFAVSVHDDGYDAIDVPDGTPDPVGENPNPVQPAYAPVGDSSAGDGPVEARYGLGAVRVQRQTAGGWTDVPDVYGSWAPVPTLPEGDRREGEAPPMANTKLRLYSPNPFAYVRHTSGTWGDAMAERAGTYPCIGADDCWEFTGLTRGDFTATPGTLQGIPITDITRTGDPGWPSFKHFASEPTDPIRVGDVATPDGLQGALTVGYVPPDEGQSIQALLIDLPEARRSVAVETVATKHCDALVLLGTDTAGETVSDVVVAPGRKAPGGVTRLVVTGREHAIETATLLTIYLDADGGATLGDLSLLSVCAASRDLATVDALDAVREQSVREQVARLGAPGAVFEPYSTYRIAIDSTIQARGLGEFDWYSEQRQRTDYAYFRTDGPPGLAELSVPTGGDAGTFDSGLTDLTRYVRATVPETLTARGERPRLPRPVYRAYDVGALFNQDYVDQLYWRANRDLALVLFDRNNDPARTLDGRLRVTGNQWGNQPTIVHDVAERQWLQAIDRGDCVDIDDAVLARDDLLTAAVGLGVLEPDEVYEARLVPRLLRDPFDDTTYYDGGDPPWQVLGDGPGDWTVTGHPALEGAVATPTAGGFHLQVRDPATPEGGDPGFVDADLDDVEAGVDVVRFAAATSDAKTARITAVDAAAGTIETHPTPSFTTSSWQIPGRGTAAQTAPVAPDAEGSLWRRDAVAGAPNPDTWTDYRAATTITLDDPDVAAGLAVRSESSGAHVRYVVDAAADERRLVHDDGTTTTTLDVHTERPVTVGQPYAVVVEVVDDAILVTEDDTVVATATADIEPAGGVALYARGPARFGEVRVDDVSTDAPVAYRFAFTTSRFANVAHHLGSYADETWSTNTSTPLAPTSTVPLTAADAAPTTDEARAYADALATLDRATGTTPDRVEATTIHEAGVARGLLLESPEPIDWSRTTLSVAHSDTHRPAATPPDGVKVTDATYGASEEVGVLLTEDTDLADHTIEYRQGGTGFQPALDDPIFTDTPGDGDLDAFTVSGPGDWQRTDDAITCTPNGSATTLLVDDVFPRDAVWTARFDARHADTVGLVFRVAGDAGYRFTVGPAGRQLVAYSATSETVLWEDATVADQSQALAYRVEAREGRLWVYAADTLVCSVADPGGSQGMAGPYVAGPDPVTVTAFTVHGAAWRPALFTETFADPELDGWTAVDEPPETTRTSDWRVVDGTLEQRSNIYGFHGRPYGAPGTFLVSEETFGDGRVTVRLRSDDNDAIGVMVRCVDDENYYRFSMDAERGYRRFDRQRDGVTVPLWEDDAGFEPGTDYALTIDCRGDRFTGYLDGVELFSVRDDAFPTGAIALYCRANRAANFHDVHVSAAADQWATYHAFEGAGVQPAGTQYRIHAGSTSSRTGAGLHAVSIGPQARLPPTGVELRIRGPDGVRHDRWIDPGAAFTPVTDAQLTRALDGTGLLLVTGDDLAPGTYRFDVQYAREGDVTYRQDGDTSPERMTLDVVVTD